jgi:hypothetical protein
MLLLTKLFLAFDFFLHALELKASFPWESIPMLMGNYPLSFDYCLLQPVSDNIVNTGAYQ